MTATQWLGAAVALMAALEVAHFLYNRWRYFQTCEAISSQVGRMIDLETRIVQQNEYLYRIAEAVDVLEVDDYHPTIDFGFRGRYRIIHLKPKE